MFQTFWARLLKNWLFYVAKQMLKIPRTVFYRACSGGDLNLKHVQYKTDDLLIHRMIQNLILSTQTLTYEALLIAIRDLELVSPIDVRKIREPMQLFTPQL